MQSEWGEGGFGTEKPENRMRQEVNETQMRTGKVTHICKRMSACICESCTMLASSRKNNSRRLKLLGKSY